MAENELGGEAGALTEFLQLQRDPVLRGVGVPRGDGRPVIVLPGLFGNDIYLQPLRSWLRRIGYDPIHSMMPLNAGCSNRLLDSLEHACARQIANKSGRVAIVGHSRGGMLGKALANRFGDRCSHLITIGSPLGAALRGGRAALAGMAGNSTASAQAMAATPVANAARAALRLFDPDCNAPMCDCNYMHDLFEPFRESLKVVSIYSHDDQVVPKAASHIDNVPNFEVTGTHSGLVVNAEVYPHVAEALATEH